MKSALQTTAWPLAAMLLTLLAFLPVLDAGWVSWDDDRYVLQNTHIQEVSRVGIGELFDPAVQVPDTYTPLTLITLAAEYAVAAGDASIYHRNNLLLHLLNVLLVFLLIRGLTGNNGIAFFVAVLFGVHPAHVEAVAWIAARKDVLYGAFFLLSLLSYLRYLRATRGGPWLAAAVLLFGFSCLAKPQAIVLPLCLWLVDFWEQRKFSFRLLIDKLPFLAVAAAAVAIALSMQQADDSSVEFAHRFWASSYAYASYVVMLFAPIKLSAMHPFPDTPNGSWPWTAYASLAVGVGLAALAFTQMRKQRYLFFGLGFFTVCMAPTLHFVKLNSSIVYERFTYLGYIGLLLALALALQTILVRYNQNLKGWAAGALLIVLVAAGGAYLRAEKWYNTETLWGDVVEKYPGEHEGYTKRGIYYATSGRTDEAVADLEQALRIAPHNAYALNTIGLIYLNSKNYPPALESFAHAVKHPDANAKMWMNLGLAHMNLNQLSEAAAAMEKSIELDPNDPLSYVNRGFLYQHTKQFENAFEDFEASIRLQPDFGIGYHYRGKEYFYAKNWGAAVHDFTRAIELAAQVAPSYYWRSRCFAEQGRFAPALADAEKAQKLGHNVAADYLEFLRNGQR